MLILPPKQEKTANRRSTNVERSDNEKENPTPNLNDGVIIMSPRVGNIILTTMGINKSLESDIDSATAEKILVKASKITI